MNARTILSIAAAMTLAACNSNTAPGNDTLAELDKAPTAAPQSGAAAALANVAPAGVYPGVMNDADIRSIGGTDGRCVFRMTRIGLPAFVYGGSQQVGTIKLNGKLVMIPASGQSVYADGPLTVQMLDQAGAEEEATIILRIAGTDNELGFRGFSNCEA